MGISVPEERPDTFSNWGDGNPTPSESIVEPPGGLQQSGWTPSQKPPSQHMNWLHWIDNLWTKNLDVRAPRIPLFKWFIGEQSGAHFATLAAALASSSVQNGDWIYFSPSTANTALATAVTINKSVKITCEPGTTFSGSDTRAFIIAADDVELNGAAFDDSWDAGGDVVIEITGDRARIIKCNFDETNTRLIDADTLAEADQPILSQNYPESLLDRQILDLWTWEAGREGVDSLAAATNNLQWLKAFSATNTWAARFPAAATGNRYWELLWMFSEGISLQIEDGNGDIWLIVPISNASFETHITVEGTAGSADYKINLLATGVGVVYDVFKNGSSVANFSTFTTLASGSMDADSFRAVLYGDKAKPQTINGTVVQPSRPKKRWFRMLTGDLFTGDLLTSDTIAMRMAFEKGKVYELNFNADVTLNSGTSVRATVTNHFSTFTENKYVYAHLQQMPSSAVSSIKFTHRFAALEEDLAIKLSVQSAFDYGLHTVDQALNYMKLEGRYWPAITVLEV